MRRLISAVVAALLPFAAGQARAANLPTGFTESVVAAGLASPTAMAFAPDGRLFVCEQGGRLRVIKGGSLLAQPFLTVSVNSAGERGLLGVAFDPGFATNRFVYVYYTTASGSIHNRVSRFTASAANTDVAAAGTETQILNLPNLSSATNHNGGAIHFGPDGKLYIAVGENANANNARLLTTTLGKMLRINNDGTIPSDNPFLSQTSGQNQAIWALGLRNPFTFGFQPGTGRMHINDVGQNTWEEVSQGVAGANYGWPDVEGPQPPGQAGVRYPVHSYANEGSNCAIVGAAFYNPPARNFPETFVGRYFFGDFCGGFIRTLSPPAYTQSSAFATGISSLIDIAVSADGALYYLARGGGSVFRVVSTSSQAPAITQHPQSRTVSVGQSVSFQVTASGSQPLRFQWQRNGANIAGATASTFTIASPALSDNGATFRAIVTNDFGSATSNSATLTVTSNTPPVGTIQTPANQTLYRGGESFTFSGVGSDAEDGTLPAGAFTWRVDFHHDDHVHPFVAPVTGVRNGSFTIDTRGETATNVFYRVILTVRDSGGLTHTSTSDLIPRTSTLTLASAPTGLQLTLDGQPVTAPLTFASVEGIIRSIGAVSPQTSGGTTYELVSWSDGGAATHEISTPVNDTTYTAQFQPSTTTTVFSDGFETNLGWTRNRGGGDTATLGLWQRGDPQPTQSGSNVMQLGTGAGGSTNCLATGLTAGAAVGTNDVDGGTTTIDSPAIVLPSGTLTLSVAFYFAHLNNSSNADFFRASIDAAGTTTLLFEERGTAATDVASWVTRTVDLTPFAGQTIRLRFQTADASGGSLIEAGVDNVSITRR